MTLLSPLLENDKVKRFNRRFEIVVWSTWIGLFGLLYAVWFINVTPDSTGYFYSDFYPLWWAGQRVVDGQAVYGSEAIAAMHIEWTNAASTQASTGFAYPFITGIIAIPFTVFSLYTAHILWVIGGCLLLCSGLFKHGRYAPFLIFAPHFFHAVYLGQAHLWAIAGLVWWWWAYKEDLHQRAWIISALTCCLKPQVGLVALVVSSYRLFRTRRRAFVQSMAVVGTLFLLTLLWYPSWIGDWITQIRLYRSSFIDQWQVFTVLTLVISLLGFLTPMRGILGQYLLTPYSGNYTMMGGALLLAQAEFRWIVFFVLAAFAIPFPWFQYLFFTAIIGFLVIQVYRTFWHNRTLHWWYLDSKS